MYYIAVLEDDQWKILGNPMAIGVPFDRAILSYAIQARSRGVNNVMLLLQRPMNTIVESNLFGSPITPDEKAYLERTSNDTK